MTKGLSIGMCRVPGSFSLNAVSEVSRSFTKPGFVKCSWRALRPFVSLLLTIAAVWHWLFEDQN